MKYTKVILLSTVCLFGSMEDIYSADYPALGYFSLMPTSGIHTYHTQYTLTDDSLFLPSGHPRSVSESSPRLVFSKSAMLNRGLRQPKAGEVKKAPDHRTEYKEASVCFITDTTDCRGESYDIPEYNICIEEGYDKTSCPDEFYIPENYCPYDSKYFANCRDVCEEYVECVDPYYGVGEPCRGLYERCECNDCSGYVFENDIPQGYHKDGEPCNSCDGPKYKYKINTCDDFMECTGTGPEDGAEVCWRGDTPTYSSCKPCANLGELEVCPAHYICEYEECSGKYYKTGCEEGYIWDDKAKTCTPECDPNDRTCQCPGKYFCDERKNQVGEGAVCTTADGTKFYEKCLVKETCFSDGTETHYTPYVTDKGICQGWIGKAKYNALYKCTTQTGKVYYYNSFCGQEEPDCAGNIAPCAGYKWCDNGPALGAAPCPIACGGHSPDKPLLWSECDTCTSGNTYANGGMCMSWGQTYDKSKVTYNYGDPSITGKGRYYVKDRCTTSVSKKTFLADQYCNTTQLDCLGRTPPCAGMCDGEPASLDVEKCECGNKTFYSACDSCKFSSSFSENGGSCMAQEEYYETPDMEWYGQQKWGDQLIKSDGSKINNYYFVKYKCTTVVYGTKQKLAKECNSTTLDCSGNMPPCAGMKECSTGTFGSGDACSCGGKIYFNECVTECNFEDTAETCAAKGQNFEQKCYGTANGQQVWLGQCK